MLSLTFVSSSNVVIGDVKDKFKLPCQGVHAVTVTVCRRPDSNRHWLTPALKATDLDHSATTLQPFIISLKTNIAKCFILPLADLKTIPDAVEGQDDNRQLRWQNRKSLGVAFDTDSQSDIDEVSPPVQSFLL